MMIGALADGRDAMVTLKNLFFGSYCDNNSERL